MNRRSWKRMSGGSPGARVFAAYIAIVMLVAMLGPGLAVYAADGELDVLEPVEESVASVVVPAAEAVLEAEEQLEIAPVEEAPEVIEAKASVPTPDVYPDISVAATVDPVPSPDPAAPLGVGGIKINPAVTGVYTATSTEVVMNEPVPDDFQVTLQVFARSDGWYLSFASNYRVTKVIVRSRSGANIYDYGAGIMADSFLHAALGTDGPKWEGPGCVQLYFAPVETTGHVTALKYEDLNRNQVWDTPGEPVLEGWKMTLKDSAGATVATGLTNAEGKVVFANLAPGEYTVAETLQAGWNNSTALVQPATVVAGQGSEVRFGNYHCCGTGDLTVYKYWDASDDGFHDDGELMLRDWFFTLYDSENNVVRSGQTAADGSIHFDDLQPGQYHVIETLQSGWRSTTGLTLDVTIAAGDDKELWFGNIPVEEDPETGDLVVHKFRDDNENQRWDAGEPMLEDWHFTLTHESLPPQPSASAIELVGQGDTGADGTVTFTELQPGQLYVTETLQDGWENTTDLKQSVEIVAGETAHVWFGNIPSLAFTELDLAITKVADDHTVDEGQLVTYTLTYWNLSADEDAYDYTIVDDYDERYITIVDANGGTVSDGKITWNFAGPLTAAMGEQRLSYTARVIADMPDRKTNIDNVVRISDDRDFNESNNVDDERVVYDPDDPYLPFTGGEFGLLAGAALLASVAGVMLRRKPRAS